MNLAIFGLLALVSIGNGYFSNKRKRSVQKEKQQVLTEENVKRWSNAELEVIRTAFPENGKPLVIAAKHKAEYQRKSCSILFPQGHSGIQSVKVIDGVVYDDHDMPVDDIEAWDDGDDNTCGIKILEKLPDHDDSLSGHNHLGFLIQLGFLDISLFGTGTDDIDVEVHVNDELLSKPHTSVYNDPVNYNLSLIPDLLSTESLTKYTGNMKMSFSLPTSRQLVYPPVYFHMDGLDIRQLKAYLKLDTNPPILETLIIDRIKIDLQMGEIGLGCYWDGEKLAEEEYSVLIFDVDFTANIEPEDHPYGHSGLFKEHCTENSEKYCWFSQFEATSARNAFPCSDFPSKKATFDMRVARTDGWRTLSNMPIENSFPVEGMEGWVWDVFQTTPPMSTYLVAFAIQDFPGIEGALNVTIWANKEDIDAGLANYTKIIAPKLLDLYSSLFGIPYTLPKMDMVSVPNKGGAMENWGLTLFDKETLLYDQANPDVEKKWRVLSVVAHELAHQWFGNLVTMDWWDQTWLNEGFASYISYLGAEAIDPEMHSWERMICENMLEVLKEDSTNTSWAMSDPVTSPRDIGRKFGSITYSKGASVIRMMEAILGFPTFIKGLSSYLADLGFSNAQEEDLFFHLETAGLEDGAWPQGDEVSFVETMKSWTNQPGYPLVTVRMTAEDLVLSQSWYRDGFDDSTDQVWDIPINFVTIGNVDPDWDDTAPSHWLSGISTTISLTADFSGPIVLNKKATGYYRVNYDEDNWIQLAQTLINDHQAIHPLNRAQIICDVISLARSGHLSQEIKNKVMEYIDQETDLGPLNAVKECTEDGKKIIPHKIIK